MPDEAQGSNNALSGLGKAVLRQDHQGQHHGMAGPSGGIVGMTGPSQSLLPQMNAGEADAPLSTGAWRLVPRLIVLCHAVFILQRIPNPIEAGKRA